MIRSSDSTKLKHYPPQPLGGKRYHMSSSRVCVIAICILTMMGCSTSTQPGPLSGILSFNTDSTSFNRFAGSANIPAHIHNGTDSAVVFAACCDVALRVDSLKSTNWAYGIPGWDQPCVAICLGYLPLPIDSTCTIHNLAIQDTGTYRLVAIFAGGIHYAQFQDTLVSNTFQVR